MNLRFIFERPVHYAFESIGGAFFHMFENLECALSHPHIPMTKHKIDLENVILVEELPAKNNRHLDLHTKSVSTTLPKFAKRLREEHTISDYNHKPCALQVFKEWRRVRIMPDLMLIMPSEDRILVEVANPRDPKRFIGELVYPRLLGYCGLISAVFMFVLYPAKQTGVQDRVMQQSWMLADVFESKVPYVAFPWAKSEEINYLNLESFIKHTAFPKNCVMQTR